MAEIRGITLIEMQGSEAPSYEELIKHFDRYGLSNSGTGYRGATPEYKNYKKLATDPFVQVAFDFLGKDSYVRFVEYVGYSHMADEAALDWAIGHDEETP